MIAFDQRTFVHVVSFRHIGFSDNVLCCLGHLIGCAITLLGLRFARALRVVHARFRAAALGWPATAKPFAILAAPPTRPPA
jgi:hypothetical protein